MNSVFRYYRYIFKKHIFSWRMLATVILSILTMDAFMSTVRNYSEKIGEKMSQWGFALIWNNKYVGLCFVLIFIFAASAFPEERINERYMISRMGVSNWIRGQALYIFTFGWLYTFFLYFIQNLLLWNVLSFGKEWGTGWATLSNDVVSSHYNVLTPTPYLVIANYEPARANLLVVLIMGLLFGMMGMLIFWLNFYSRIMGVLASSALVFLSLTAIRNVNLPRYSPVSWINLTSHYSIIETNRPTVEYIFGMLLLFTVLFFLMAKFRANNTQENNRRSR